MAIAEMIKLTIAGLIEDAEGITQVLQKKGVIQIDVQIMEEPEKRLADFVNLQTRILAADEVVSGLKSALDFMEKRKQVNKGALGTFIGWHYRVDEDKYLSFISGGEARARQIIKAASELEQRINGIENELKSINSQIEQLRPWASITVPIAEFSGMKKHEFFFLGAEASRKKANIDDIISGINLPIAFFEISEYENRRYYAVALRKEDGSEALRRLVAQGFEIIRLPETMTPPALEIERLDARKAALEIALAEASEQAIRICDQRPEAFCLYDHFSNEKARYEKSGEYLSTRSAFVTGGWARKDKVEGLIKAIERIAPKAAVLTREPQEGEDVPVELVNNGIMNPFEAVTRLMGLPKHGTVDPTPFLGVFFFIYFGTCMGDVVYGIVLAAIGLLMLKRIKTAGMGTQLLQLMVVGGLATIVMGILFGGYLGDLLSKVIKPVWFDPMSDQGPLIFLAFSFGLGVIQIFFGMGIKAWDNLRNGRWLSAIYDQGFWMTLIIGLGLMLGGGSLGGLFPAVGKWMSIVSAAGLVLTQGRHHKHPVVRLGSGIVSLYNITAYMSDIVSYSRLFGLGFTSIVIGMVINYIARMLLGIPVLGYVLFAIVVVAGHAFNLFINIPGAFIHSSRLQYVEFFGKFADFGGTKFTPFKEFNKYVDIDFKEAR